MRTANLMLDRPGLTSNSLYHELNSTEQASDAGWQAGLAPRINSSAELIAAGRV
ncbi:MAG: hypothetical protein JO319_02565 [Acidobacteriaceae bacterium]|nr:hypothetical protein [Acidobacteriaceae bacterium]